MTKRNKIIYWVSTLWACLGMVSTAIIQLVKSKEGVDTMSHLGYPVYFLAILGTWKILGVVALLTPKFPLLKEWAYAGFFFAMTGAAISRIAVGDPVREILPSLFLLCLVLVSWYFNRQSSDVNRQTSIVNGSGVVNLQSVRESGIVN
jgi:hypothetical protein